jgi:hypothetical protein
MDPCGTATMPLQMVQLTATTLVTLATMWIAAKQKEASLDRETIKRELMLCLQANKCPMVQATSDTGRRQRDD